MKERDWDRLLWNLQRQTCILLLGPEAISPDHPASVHLLSRRLATEMGREDLVSSGLAEVAQRYVQGEQFDRLDLEREVARFFSASQPIPQIYEDMAALPFYLTLSSCHDDLLVRAFRAAKTPSFAYYNYRGGAQDLVPMGTVSRPLVYGLYGATREPSSLVLTETDLLDFLVAVITRNPALPANIQSELAKNVSFLFLGFGMHQWYLRILLHVLQFNGRKRAFAFEPGSSGDGESTVFFFAGYRIEVINCELAQFVSELRQRFVAAGGDVAATPPLADSMISPKVFLCYASEDAQAAERIYRGLRASGLDVWMDRQELKAGDAWDRAVRDRVNDADYFLVVHSAALATKNFSYVNREINLAWERQPFARSGFRFIIPVQVDEEPPLPEFAGLQALRLRTDEDLAALVSVVKRDYQRRSRASA